MIIDYFQSKFFCKRDLRISVTEAMHFIVRIKQFKLRKNDDILGIIKVYRCELGSKGVKFSEVFLKSFYRSKIVFHLEF